MPRMKTTTTLDLGTITQSGKVKRSRVVTRRGAPDKIYGNFKSRSYFGWVPTDEILVDLKYQRDLDLTRVSVYAHNWDQDMAGVLVVSKRENGKYYVIDGQHRHGALQLMENYPDNTFCQIFEGLSPKEEAALFRKLDNERRNLTPTADYKAALASEDAIALAVKQSVEDAGMFIDAKKGNVAGNVRSVKTLYKVHRRVGSAGLTRILSVLNAAWPDHKDATNFQLILGLEAFFKHYPKASNARVAQVLRRTEPAQIVSRARDLKGNLSSAIWENVAFVVYNRYNTRLKANRLSNWDGAL